MNKQSVQQKFLRLAVKYSGHPMSFGSHDDSHCYNILDNLNLPARSKRRMISDIVFISKVTISIADCLNILQSLFIDVPRRS